MNRYGRLGMRHWQAHLPKRFARIKDPHDFFRILGSEVETEIAELSSIRTAEAVPAGNLLDRIGQLQQIRTQTEQEVLVKRVLLAPESDLRGPWRSFELFVALTTGVVIGVVAALVSLRRSSRSRTKEAR